MEAQSFLCWMGMVKMNKSGANQWNTSYLNHSIQVSHSVQIYDCEVGIVAGKDDGFCLPYLIS